MDWAYFARTTEKDAIYRTFRRKYSLKNIAENHFTRPLQGSFSMKFH